MMPHGTQSRYGNNGCRCARCLKAHRLYDRARNGSVSWAEYVARKKANANPTHGRASTYNNGCRCAPCTEVARLRKARQRAAKRAAT